MYSKRIWVTLTILGCISGFSLSACADRPVSTGPAIGTETPDPGATFGDAPPINWDAPYGEAAPKLSGPADLEGKLPFEPVIPAFSTPDLIQLGPEGPARTIVMVFHLPLEGTVMVEEGPADEEETEALRAFAAARTADLSAGSDATFEMIPLRGSEALFVSANGIGRLVWVESGVRIDITGETVTPVQVLALAEAF